MAKLDYDVQSLLSQKKAEFAPPAPTYNYSSWEDLKKDSAFMGDLRQHYQAKGVTGSDDDLVDEFFSDRNWADLNSLGIASDTLQALSANPEARARSARLEEAWRKVPAFWQDGGRGWSAVPDIAKSVIVDPLNLIPGGALGKGARTTALEAAKAGGKLAVEGAVKDAAIKGALSSTAKQAGLMAGAGAGLDILTQVRDDALDLQEGIDLSRAAGAGLLAAAGQTVIGGPLEYLGQKSLAGKEADEIVKGIGKAEAEATQSGLTAKLADEALEGRVADLSEVPETPQSNLDAIEALAQARIDRAAAAGDNAQIQRDTEIVDSVQWIRNVPALIASKESRLAEIEALKGTGKFDEEALGEQLALRREVSRYKNVLTRVDNGDLDDNDLVREVMKLTGKQPEETGFQPAGDPTIQAGVNAPDQSIEAPNNINPGDVQEVTNVAPDTTQADLEKKFMRTMAGKNGYANDEVTRIPINMGDYSPDSLYVPEVLNGQFTGELTVNPLFRGTDADPSVPLVEEVTAAPTERPVVSIRKAEELAEVALEATDGKAPQAISILRGAKNKKASTKKAIEIISTREKSRAISVAGDTEEEFNALFGDYGKAERKSKGKGLDSRTKQRTTFIENGLQFLRDDIDRLGLEDLKPEFEHGIIKELTRLFAQNPKSDPNVLYYHVQKQFPTYERLFKKFRSEGITEKELSKTSPDGKKQSPDISRGVPGTESGKVTTGQLKASLSDKPAAYQFMIRQSSKDGTFQVVPARDVVDETGNIVQLYRARSGEKSQARLNKELSSYFHGFQNRTDNAGKESSADAKRGIYQDNNRNYFLAGEKPDPQAKTVYKPIGDNLFLEVIQSLDDFNAARTADIESSKTLTEAEKAIQRMLLRRKLAGDYLDATEKMVERVTSGGRAKASGVTANKLSVELAASVKKDLAKASGGEVDNWVGEWIAKVEANADKLKTEDEFSKVLLLQKIYSAAEKRNADILLNPASDLKKQTAMSALDSIEKRLRDAVKLSDMRPAGRTASYRAIKQQINIARELVESGEYEKALLGPSILDNEFAKRLQDEVVYAQFASVASDPKQVNELLKFISSETASHLQTMLGSDLTAEGLDAVVSRNKAKATVISLKQKKSDGKMSEADFVAKVQQVISRVDFDDNPAISIEDQVGAVISVGGKKSPTETLSEDVRVDRNPTETPPATAYDEVPTTPASFTYAVLAPAGSDIEKAWLAQTGPGKDTFKFSNGRVGRIASYDFKSGAPKQTVRQVVSPVVAKRIPVEKFEIVPLRAIDTDGKLAKKTMADNFEDLRPESTALPNIKLFSELTDDEKALANTIKKKETVSWKSLKTEAELKRHTEELASLYRSAPEFWRPVQEREAAYKQVEELFEGQDPNVIYTAKNLLRDLAGEKAPIFGAVRNNRTDEYDQLGRYVTDFANSEDNKILLNVGRNPAEVVTTFVHELGHWGYFNVLDNADRANYWAYVSKYYKEGKVDLDKVLKNSVNPDNASSPQELFAESMSRIFLERKKLAGDMGFWKRIFSKFQKMIGVVMGNPLSDPEMNRLYDKIFPGPLVKGSGDNYVPRSRQSKEYFDRANETFELSRALSKVSTNFMSMKWPDRPRAEAVVTNARAYAMSAANILPNIKESLPPDTISAVEAAILKLRKVPDGDNFAAYAGMFDLELALNKANAGLRELAQAADLRDGHGFDPFNVNVNALMPLNILNGMSETQYNVASSLLVSFKNTRAVFSKIEADAARAFNESDDVMRAFYQSSALEGGMKTLYWMSRFKALTGVPGKAFYHPGFRGLAKKLTSSLYKEVIGDEDVFTKRLNDATQQDKAIGREEISAAGAVMSKRISEMNPRQVNDIFNKYWKDVDATILSGLNLHVGHLKALNPTYRNKQWFGNRGRSFGFNQVRAYRELERMREERLAIENFSNKAVLPLVSESVKFRGVYLHELMSDLTLALQQGRNQAATILARRVRNQMAKEPFTPKKNVISDEIALLKDSELFGTDSNPGGLLGKIWEDPSLTEAQRRDKYDQVMSEMFLRARTNREMKAPNGDKVTKAMTRLMLADKNKRADLNKYLTPVEEELSNISDTRAILPRSDKVKRAAKAEAKQNSAGFDENGISIAVTPDKAELLLRATFRDPDTRSALQTFMNKAFNLIDDGGEVVSEYDLHRMSGFEPVGEDGPAKLKGDAYRTLRKEYREIVKGLTTVSRPGVDVMLEVANIAYRLGLTDEDQKLFKTTGQYRDAVLTYIKGGGTKGLSSDQIEAVRQAVDTMAYLVNGVMTRTDIKEKYRYLTAYGDMNAGHVDKAPDKPRTIVTVAEAPKVAADRVSNLTKQEANGIDLFTNRFSWNGGKPAVLYIQGAVNDVIVEPSSFVPALTDGKYGKGVYLSSNLQVPKKPTQDLKDAHNALLNIQERMAKAKSPEIYARLRSEATSLSESIVLKGEQAVAPVFPRINKLFDATADWDMTSPSFDEFFSLATPQGLTQSEVDEFRKSVGAYLREELGVKVGSNTTSIRGEDLLEAVGAAYKNFADQDFDTQRVLKQLGYDAIKYEDDKFAVFNRSSVWHANDQRLAKDMIETVDEPERAGVISIEAALKKFNDEEDVEGLDSLTKSGLHSSTVQSMSDILKNKPTQRLFETLENMTSFLKGSVEYARHHGAEWFAKKVAPDEGTGLVQAHDVRRAEYFLPIKNVVEKNFGKGAIASHLEFLRTGGKPKQPEALDKVVRALRRRDPKRLPPKELEVYDTVVNFLGDPAKKTGVLGDLINSGAVTYTVRNYFPQVYDTEKIEKDLGGFKAAMTKYFQKEALLSGKTMTLVDAQERASQVAHRLIEDNGLWMPPRAETKGSNFGAQDYQRLIRLHETDSSGQMLFRGELAEIEKYFDNNLLGIMAKYTDEAALRVEQSQRFGRNGLGFWDYLTIAQKGEQGAIDLLTSDRIMYQRYKVVADKDDLADDVTDVAVKQMLIPAFKNPIEAKGILDQVTSTLDQYRTTNKQLGVQKALDLLLAARPNMPDNFKSHWKIRAEALVNGLADFGEQRAGVPREIVGHLEKTYRRMVRKPVAIDATWADKAYKFSRGMRAFNSVTLLPFTVLASIGDATLPVVRSGSMAATIKAYKRMATDPVYRQSIKNVGASINRIISNHSMNSYGEPLSRVETTFHEATFLGSWTGLQREVSSAIGLESFRLAQKKVLDHKASGSLNSTREVRRLTMFMKQFGLEHYLQPGASTLADDTAIAKRDVKEAMIKFANETIFEPGFDEKPLWAQGPFGSLAFQLKSYPLAFQKLAGRTIKDALMMENGKMFGNGGEGKFTGDPMPLFYLLTLTAGAGYVSSLIRDYVQGRGGDDEKSHASRERTLTKIAEKLGYEYSPESETLDKFLGGWIEGLMAAGGLGLIANTLYDSAAQLDNGAYGKERIISMLFGPSAGTVMDSISVVQGMTDWAGSGDENGIGKEREAVRKLVSRIPFAGQVRSFREGAVDNIVGEVE